jgi:hypothetical protein
MQIPLQARLLTIPAAAATLMSSVHRRTRCSQVRSSAMISWAGQPPASPPCWCHRSKSAAAAAAAVTEFAAMQW